MKIKTTTTLVIKYESKHSPMSEGNTCRALPNLEVLTLTRLSKGLVSSFCKIFLKK